MSRGATMMMKLWDRSAAFAVLAVCALAAPAAPAQEQPDPSKLNLTYNEEVVRKLLKQTDPDVAYLARLKMMRGHLNAAIMTTKMGDLAEAHEHIMHPASEILPEINAALKTYGVSDLAPSLDAIMKTMHDKDHAITLRAIDAALVEVGKGEAAIDPSKMNAGGIVPDTVVLLLRTAVTEYSQAFKYGKIVNLVEYHDGAAFVAEARKLLDHIQPALAARDAKAVEKILQSWATLETAWPGVKPPETTVLPVSKMLALVTIIELQLNKMRGGA
jgi:hypothetical protein